MAAPSPSPAPGLTGPVLQAILTDLIDALSRDMRITRVTRTPAGDLFTVTSRSRPGRTHEVCQLAHVPGQPQAIYSCQCEHGIQIDRQTPANRHAHCWHVRFVHFMLLEPAQRQQLFTHTTGNAVLAGYQQALEQVWTAYMARHRPVTTPRQAASRTH